MSLPDWDFDTSTVFNRGTGMADVFCILDALVYVVAVCSHT